MTSLRVPSHSLPCFSSFVTAAVAALRSAQINTKTGRFTTWLIGVADDSYYMLRVKRKTARTDGEGRWMIMAEQMCFSLFLAFKG